MMVFAPLRHTTRTLSGRTRIKCEKQTPQISDTIASRINFAADGKPDDWNREQSCEQGVRHDLRPNPTDPRIVDSAEGERSAEQVAGGHHDQAGVVERALATSRCRACTEPGGSACGHWNGHGTQCNHPAQKDSLLAVPEETAVSVLDETVETMTRTP